MVPREIGPEEDEGDRREEEADRPDELLALRDPSLFPRLPDLGLGGLLGPPLVLGGEPLQVDVARSRTRLRGESSAEMRQDRERRRRSCDGGSQLAPDQDPEVVEARLDEVREGLHHEGQGGEQDEESHRERDREALGEEVHLRRGLGEEAHRDGDDEEGARARAWKG